MHTRYLLPLLLLSNSSVFASTQSTVAFSLDNDGIYGVDQDYTNGLFLNYTSGQITPPAWLSMLSLSDAKQHSIDKWQLTLAHKMWTPSDIEMDTPIANDRPYAGYFHGEINYLSLTTERVQQFNLTLGMTGEHSLADKAQKIVHGITGSDDPNGWDYQIESKVAGSIGYINHLNLKRGQMTLNSEWEVSNVSEINAGNFRSDVSTGLMFRWGKDLDHNMGAANISTEHPFRAGAIGQSKQAWFIFSGIEARYRFNDMTIEGNRPAIENDPDISDPSIYDVDLKHLQASAVLGVAWYNQHFGASFTTTLKTPDYKQATNDIYGTGGLSLFAFF